MDIMRGMAQLHVKVVPGSTRDRVAGRLGDALKLQVSAAPERGKANDAVIALIAATLGLPRSCIQIVRGQSQPRKLLQINGIEQSELDRRLSAFQ
jgi:uncharacterized protein YggU (UPF0235/DUF167 family)